MKNTRHSNIPCVSANNIHRGMFQIFKVEKENNMKGKSSQKNVLQTEYTILTPKAPLEVDTTHTLPQESLRSPKQSPGKH